MAEKIKVVNLAKTIDSLNTIENISLSLQGGEIAVILGPSGCGKSTLLHLIAGLIKPDRGRIFIEGADWTGRSGRVGYMQQKSLLMPFASVLDNVCLPLVIKGQGRSQAREEARRHLDYFGLAGFEHYYPQQLSGGMKQRAAMLRTFLFNSDILLLDEPFAALDAITRRKMHLWLKEVQHHFAMSILFVTHDLDEALLLGDRLYLLSPRPVVVQKEVDIRPGSADAIKQAELKQAIFQALDAAAFPGDRLTADTESP